MNADTHNTMPGPPRLAEQVLRLFLNARDRETVSGDLLEEYRESIRPARGPWAADAWYVRQVGGFLWRTTWMWALLFSGHFVARTAYDWFVPTADFHARSNVSTWSGVAILLSMGFWTAWRSRSLLAGTLFTVVASQIVAVISLAGNAVLLTIWHDPKTMKAIAGSGGIEEVFMLPFMMAIPAGVLGTVGGAVGAATRKFLRLATSD